MTDTKDDYEERLKVAEEYIGAIKPLERALESILTAMSAVPEGERAAQVYSAVADALDLKAAEKTIIEAAADVYTLEELKSLSDFFNSKVGQSLSAKQIEFTAKTTPLILASIDFEKAGQAYEEALRSLDEDEGPGLSAPKPKLH